MVLLARLVCVLATAVAPARAAADPVLLLGTVTDSITGRPVAQASASLAGGLGADLTDLDGRFRIPGVPPGSHTLRIRHTAYEEEVRRLAVPEGRDSIVVDVRLRPRVYTTGEFVVQADRVVPLTAGEKTRYTVPRSSLREWGVDDAAEIVRRLPGVVLLGNRAFFRGIGFEHVLPLLDGVPAREPLRGEWITPPPDALLLAHYTPGAFDAGTGQALAGIFEIELPGGSPRHEARASAETDRWMPALQDSQTTDLLQATVEGPIHGRIWSYAASWQGRLSDGSHRYSHARPGHRLLGLRLGDRMSADFVGMVRLICGDPARPPRAAITYLGREMRAKTYHHHYAREGWVGWSPEYDRYTTFVDPETTPDSVVFYDGPPHVPTRSRVSRLVQGSANLGRGQSASLRLSVRAAEHIYRSRPEGRAFHADEELVDWIRSDVTRSNHQEEAYFATHGFYPDYEDGASRELGAAAQFRARRGGHELSAGGGATAGRHRFAASRPGIDWMALGSLTRWTRTIDGFGYLQDTWWSDVHSSMTLALRWDARRLSRGRSDASASTMSPRIGFRQPFSDRDAIHVEYGVLYQFPTLLDNLLLASGEDDARIELKAQSSRAFEVGVQHHLSTRAVLYIAAHVVEYADITFSPREASEEDELFPGTTPRAAATTIESRGVEILLDHRFHRKLTGQFRFEAGDQSSEGAPLPWGREAVASGWLTARPTAAFDLSLFGRWDTGRPYSICLKKRGCDREQLYEGRLPSPLDLDLSARWSPGGRTGRAHLTLEVRNLLGRRIATFDFGSYGTSVGSGNFIAYYDRYARAGGYLLDTGSEVRPFHVENPQTRSAGRTIRLGLEASL